MRAERAVAQPRRGQLGLGQRQRPQLRGVAQARRLVVGPVERRVLCSCLDHHREPLPDADADRRDPPAAAAAAQLVHERAEDAHARRAQRVPDRDRAAVDVQPLRIQIPTRPGTPATAPRTPRSAPPPRCPPIRCPPAPAPGWPPRPARCRTRRGRPRTCRAPRSARAARGPPPRRPRRSPSSSAPAPSLSGDALPAVTVPSFANAGFSFASFSTDVSGRMPSSRACSSSPTGTGTTHES